MWREHLRLSGFQAARRDTIPHSPAPHTCDAIAITRSLKNPCAVFRLPMLPHLFSGCLFGLRLGSLKPRFSL
ncbi:hypothetical protein [Kingella oralis]|uniref:hypothetical protein n=1 Tax=Kingella oralis TaxID=505 RepID=UPI00259797A6|nr:hypothetical protein [Kingella oralis]